LYFDRFVEELFNCPDKESAFAMIADAETRGFMQNLEGSRLRGGVTNISNDLFYEEGSEDKDSWNDDREDGELDKLVAE
jgi:hypothetical protein